MVKCESTKESFDLLARNNYRLLALRRILILIIIILTVVLAVGRLWIIRPSKYELIEESHASGWI